METSALKSYLNDISKFRVLTKEEEETLFAKAKSGDKNARAEIINCNLRLVVSIAKKYQAQHLQLMDLIQEGNLGLLQAYDKYDISKGYKFSTYATWWIKQNIGNAISNKNDMIRKPVYLKENIAKMKKVASQIELSNGGETATAEQIASAMKISKKSVENMQNVINNSQVVSMETPLNSETDDTLQDFIADEESETPDEVASKNDTKRVIMNAIQKVLTSREQEVILMRNGFTTGEEETLQAIGDKLGLTRERVRQLESQALKKLAKVKELKDLA